MEPDKKNHQLFYGIALLCVLSIVCMLVYKAQIRDKLDKPIHGTLMSEHKDNNTIYINEDSPVFTEMFICRVPELKQLRIQCKGKKMDAEAVLVMTLADADSGKEYYHKEKKVSELIKGKNAVMIAMKLKEKLSDSEGKQLILSWELLSPGQTQLALTANVKPGMVIACNGQQDNKSNVIYDWKYADSKELKSMYALLCAAVLFMAMVAYNLIIIRKLPADKFYLPTALILGMIFQVLIPVYGVPDEPWHMDTAYKYSNKLLLVEDTGVPGTIYKRQCDIEMGDLLANGVESNSYYMLKHHTFEKSVNTELKAVNYVDSSNLVPGIVFLPGAIGISIGRILRLPALITLQLGRICNLIFFVLVCSMAIRRIPYGKNLLALLGLLPIAMQQGASVSYDAVINGILFLFIAECFRISEAEQRSKKDWFLLLLLGALTVLIKSGVYAPILLMLFLPRTSRRKKNKGKPNYKKICIWGGICITVAVILFWKYIPVVRSLLQGSDQKGKYYTISEFVNHPLKLLYIYWNTFMVKGDNYLKGLLGGKLSWLDIEVKWIFIVILLVGTLLMVNVEGDCLVRTTRHTVLMVAASGISFLLILLSMIFACTPLDSMAIEGVQGRYFLGIAPLFFFLLCTDMVKVSEKQCAKVWMTMLVTEIMIVLQVAVMAM